MNFFREASTTERQELAAQSHHDCHRYAASLKKGKSKKYAKHGKGKKYAKKPSNRECAAKTAGGADLRKTPKPFVHKFARLWMSNSLGVLRRLKSRSRVNAITP